MVEFLFTKDNNSVDNEEQPSEYFYDVSTSNVLNNITLCLDILFHIFCLALFQYWFRHWFLKLIMVLNTPLQKQPLMRCSGKSVF